MKTILVLTSTYPRWTQDTEPAFVHALCRELSGHYRVMVLAPHHAGAARVEHLDGIEVRRFRYCLPFAERLAYNGGIITNLKNNRFKLLLVPLFLISQLYNTWRLCRGHDIALIHAHWLIPQGLVALLAGGRAGKRTPVLCTSHGGDLYSLQRGLLPALKKYVVRRASHTTVVSNAMQQRLRDMGCAAGHTSVRPMGVDLRQRFIPDPAVAKTTDLVFVGRLVEKKGVTTLVQALYRLQPDYPDLTLEIVGDGPDLADLQAQVARLDLGRRVRFTGAIPNDRIPDHYRRARIAVVPSLVARDGDQEGLGLVAVEALGCGCVTVVSDLPALRDVVQDGVNGRVFRAGDAADLAARLGELLAAPEISERLAHHARASVLERFDWEAVGRGYRSLIDDLLSATADS